jgi:hypothetical protein
MTSDTIFSRRRFSLILQDVQEGDLQFDAAQKTTTEDSGSQ